MFRLQEEKQEVQTVTHRIKRGDMSETRHGKNYTSANITLRRTRRSEN